MSSVPLLRLSDKFDPYISGEVNIDPSAVIAPGVILQAALNSKIIIGPGVCIGMGSILQVSHGILEIEMGASLGAGFLMVGEGKIGANACIGSGTTVFNYSVAAQQVIPAGSILGDSSRQANSQESEESVDRGHTSSQSGEQVVSKTQFTATFVNFKTQSTSVPPPSPTPKSQSPPETESSTESQETSDGKPHSRDPTEPHPLGTQIYGQGSINRLLSTLFPHRQSLSDQDANNGVE
ncbi:transferase [Cylindrospermopsis curvispora]|uniref:Transferase n=1 Tax=Cylindrospermopsis curvispora GIHE-G1 TaxID=2666332 RepID=A0A7H0F2C0_9CYAN|nr:transferase [Cylindrospermopsis curvispora]QNP30186.1 transferase [Cylindrospermopsis curvispora GIHE-G1]